MNTNAYESTVIGRASRACGMRAEFGLISSCPRNFAKP